MALKRALHWFRGRPCQMTYNAHFDVNVVLAQYTSRTLFVDFRCYDSKAPRVVCLNIKNIDMLIFQMQKCSFTGGGGFNSFHQRLINFETFLYGCLVRHAAYIYTYFSKGRVCVKFGKNLTKSVNFLFWLSIFALCGLMSL